MSKKVVSAINGRQFFILICSIFAAFLAFKISHTASAQIKQNDIMPPTVRFSENFDAVSVPTLPSGWTTSTTGFNIPFATNADSPDSPPNAVYTNNPAAQGSAEITSPPVLLGSLPAKLTFRHLYSTETDPGYDGGVLEMSINGGEFQDIILAGGIFLNNGYTQTLSPDATGNPLYGRLVWTGNSTVYITTIVRLPASAANQSVRFRWRYGTDSVEGGFGWLIDNVQVSEDLNIGYTETFDGVAAPDLPANWGTFHTGAGTDFFTQAEFPDTPPNAVFTTEPPSVGTSELYSPIIRVGGNSPKLIFKHLFDTEPGYDGGVLEIKIGSGDFYDILEAGGTFAYGGYTRRLDTCCTNPLPARMAWSGISGLGPQAGYITTEVNLPPAAYQQLVQFRWRFGTDSSVARLGWKIDTVQVTNTISGENTTAISIPASGIAAPYPSEITVANHDGLITGVQVTLHNFTHSAPDDVDLMLVSPSGRKIVLMSDAGGATPVNNLSLSFDDTADNLLPDNAPLASGNYKPTNFEAGDAFPAPAPVNAPGGNLLASLNGSQPNGAWKLFLVDDTGANAGNVAGGWSIAIQTAPNVIATPSSGAANPYPSEFVVDGQTGLITKVIVNLMNFSHTAPDGADLMLVAPNGRRVVIMSDVGGNTEVGNLNITLNDAAAFNLPDAAPLLSGTYKPTDFEPGDAFPAPAPQGAPTGAALGAFYGILPNGVWKLYMVDDTGENVGSIAGGWNLNIQSSFGTCQFGLSSSGQSFPIEGGNGGFSVLMPPNCSWTAESDASFITIQSGTSGTGEGIVSFGVATNAGAARTGTITVSNGVFTRTFQVQQAPGCPFSLSQPILNFSPNGGTQSVEVTAAVTCSWMATTDANWLTGSTKPQPGTGLAMITAQPNPTRNSRSAIVYIGAKTLLVNQAGASTARFDFDGDRRADMGVFRTNTWFLQQSTGGFAEIFFGTATDRLVPEDYDNDGKTDLAVFRNGSWHILQSSNSATIVRPFGVATDRPVPADYNGDGRAELAIFRDGIWYINNLANNQISTVQFGLASDKPVVADYDADGKNDIAVFRPSSGIWYLLRTSQGFGAYIFGTATDKPTVGDYNGDGRADLAFYRNGAWHVSTNYQNEIVTQLGLASDIPVAADYNGDRITDYAVWRPTGGVWFIQLSQQGLFSYQFGISTDLPVPSVYVP